MHELWSTVHRGHTLKYRMGKAVNRGDRGQSGITLGSHDFWTSVSHLSPKRVVTKTQHSNYIQGDLAPSKCSSFFISHHPQLQVLNVINFVSLANRTILSCADFRLITSRMSSHYKTSIKRWVSLSSSRKITLNSMKLAGKFGACIVTNAIMWPA